MTPKAQTDTTVKEWSLEHLVEMLRDEKMPSQKLTLKDGLIEVQRVVFEGVPCIEKRYLGNISQRQNYEIEQLQRIRRTGNLAVTENVASIYSMGTEEVIFTRWFGLDTDSWRRLLPDSPFEKNVPFLLAWVRGVLKACYEFHKLGFVHCDLLPQNIVIRHKVQDVSNGQYTLMLDKPFIIDLEFGLAPLTGGTWGEGVIRHGWRYNDGRAIKLAPAWHSEYICAGEIKKMHENSEDEDKFIHLRAYQDGGPTPTTAYQDGGPFMHLHLVDWGVDLFSLGCALQDMVHGVGEGTGADFPLEHVNQNKSAYEYLLDLPKRLRSYNQLAPAGMVPRPYLPHYDIALEIDRLIGRNECEFPIKLPVRFKGPVRPPSAMLNSLDTTKVLGVPKLVHIPIMQLQVGLDPITTDEFDFQETPTEGSKPKVSVTLRDIEGYLKKLNQLLGLPTATLAQTRCPEFRKKYIGFRLLTLDEWMMVCRAGQESPNDDDYVYSIGDRWVVRGHLSPTDAVYRWDNGLLGFPPGRRPKDGPYSVEHECNQINAYGVRGMHGNVWEIVQCDEIFRKCGGAWNSHPDDLRFDVCQPVEIDQLPHISVGFRVCRTRPLE